MSRRSSPMGLGLYFIDVLACLLFCMTLALASARFGREESVDVELPRLGSDGNGIDLAAAEISIRGTGADARFDLDGRELSLPELQDALSEAPPGSVVLRSEASALSDVIAAAHDAGVRDIQIAYERGRSTGGPR